MKKNFININGSLELSEKTTFEMFKKSSLYKGQTDNRFFWLVDLCEVEGLPEKYKVGLCFKNNIITRVELYCASEAIKNETERDKKTQIILNLINENYELKCNDIENSFDKRNNYSSIIISY